MKSYQKFSLAARLNVARSKGAVATFKELLLQTFGPLILVALIMLLISVATIIS